MPDVVLSLDAEDFLTPEAADAQRWWAEELSSRELPGSFECTGELVRSLRRRQREDVLEALGRHEVGYHTDLHSIPPRHPEAVRGLSLAEGVAWVRRTESAGLQTLGRAFGKPPRVFSAPGGAWTPATLLAMAGSGVRVLANGGLAPPSLQPLWFCGLLVTNHCLRLEDFFGSRAEVEGVFRRAVAGITARMAPDGVLVLSSHPERLVTSAFWDRPFHGGRRVGIEACRPAPLRPAGQVRALQDRVRRWLDWLQATPGVRLVDFAAVAAERAHGGRDLTALLAQEGLAPGDEGRLPLREPSGGDQLRGAFLCRKRFDWPVLPAALDAGPFVETARQLTWTATASRRTARCGVPGMEAVRDGQAGGQR